MCRTKILVIALVALIAGGTHAAQGSTPAKVRRKTTAAVDFRTVRHTEAACRKLRTGPAHTRTPLQVRSARNPTHNEAERKSGHAARRELPQKRAVRRDVAFHSWKKHRVAPAMEVASASTLFLLPATAEKTEPPEAPAGNLSHARMPASANARGDYGAVTNEEMDSTERELPHENSVAREGILPGTREDESTEANRIAPPAPITPEASSETEEALLRIPRGIMPPPLFGSHESLERQNTRLDAEGLERIEDETDLEDRIAHKLLVPIPVSSALSVNTELPATHRYCRPWTASFLADLARAHDTAFHRPLEVSSAVRTMEYQKRLMEINGNAAPAEGDIVSPHLTGATVDIAKDGLSRDEISWMRRRLLALEAAGKIDVEEEFRQACFHITVYKTYALSRISQPAGQRGRRRKNADPSVAAAVQGL